MSVAQQIFQSPTQNQSSVQNNLQKPKLLLRKFEKNDKDNLLIVKYRRDLYQLEKDKNKIV